MPGELRERTSGDGLQRGITDVFTRVPAIVSSLRASPARHLAAAFVSIAALAGTLPAASAEPVKIEATYEATLTGIGIGRFYLNGEFNGGAYSISGGGENSAITQIFTNVRGWTSASGRIDGARITPSVHKLDIETDDAAQRVAFSFSRGKVADLKLSPPPRTGEDRVPLKAEHKRNVLDPVSAMIMSLPLGEITGENACNRKIPVFDGYYRYDLELSYKRTEQVPALGGGRSARLFVCQIRYVPIAGHRPTGRSNLYWTSNTGMEIWIAPIRRAGIFMPYRAVVPTPVGNAVFALSNITVSGDARRAEAK